MDGCLVVKLMFTAAMAGIYGISSDVCDNKSIKTCCYNTYFNESVKRCVECPLGRYGKNCKRKCIEGYYGYLCKEICSCEAFTCDPVTGCHNYSINKNVVSNHPAEEKTLSQTQEKTSIHKENTKLRQATRNPDSGDHHGTQIWMLVSFLLVGSLVTALIVGILVYSRTLGWCKSTSKYPYLGGESATAGHTTEVELDEQPMGAMCAANDDSDVYDEIRNSLIFNCSNSRADVRLSPCCGKGENTSKKTTQMSEKLYSEHNDEGDYSHLQLKKRRSSSFKMFSLAKSNETTNEQEEYVSLKSCDTMDEPTKNGKGRCKTLERISETDFNLPSEDKTLDRISETDFNLPTQDRKFTYSLVDCASENNFEEFNKGALYAAPETSKESPMTSTCFEAKPNKEDRPYSLVNLPKIIDDS